MRAVNLPTVPRHLHPGAWWLWALGLAAAASRTENPAPLLLVVAVTALVVAGRRTDAPWAASYPAFLRLAVLVIVVRVVLQALLSKDSQGPTVLVTLPQVPLPSGSGLQLGGQITAEAVLGALYQGLQFATILVCVGAANALGSARRLLRSVPGALYEVGVSCVIALTFAPQLVTDARRVREAHRLRGHRQRGLRAWARLAMPVLEGALERSVELAAAMDSRGYGRTTNAAAVSRRLTAGLVLGGLLGVCIGTYGLLDGTAAAWLGLPTLAGGAALAVAGIGVGGRRTRRSRYRPDPWALPEWLVAGCGLLAAVAVFVQMHRDPASLVLASVTELPPVPLLAVVGILIGALPVVLAPPPPTPAADPAVDPARIEVAA